MYNHTMLRFWAMVKRLKLTVLILLVFMCVALSWSYKELLQKTEDTQKIVNPSIDVSIPNYITRSDVDFRIVVLTYNRPWSLRRLLTSLNQADYLNDRVLLEIWIDRSREGYIDGQTYQEAKKFKFKFGDVQVYNHSRNVGIYGQWMGTWQPSDNLKEIFVILEDDLTLSPLFYRYLKQVHRKYDSRTDINGYALQLSMKHGGDDGILKAPQENIVFLYPIIGTWGFSPHRESWINFTNWYRSVSLNSTFLPLVPGILPTKWYLEFVKTGQTATIWEMWHIYFAYKQKQLTLYPNLPNDEGFSINWKERGLHYDGNDKSTKETELANTLDNRISILPDNPVFLDPNGHLLGGTINKISKMLFVLLPWCYIVIF